MPAHHAIRRLLVVANARHSPGYGCALRLDQAPFDVLLEVVERIGIPAEVLAGAVERVVHADERGARVAALHVIEQGCERRMPAHHAISRLLVVANARHSPSYGCALRLDQPPSGALLGHARNTLSL